MSVVARSSSPTLRLETAVQYVKGIGPRLGSLFTARGITTAEDLLHYLPFRYEDRTNVKPIAQLVPGETATVVARVSTFGLMRTRRGMALLQMTVTDDTGRLQCTWFNADYLRGRFAAGQPLALFGRVEREGSRLGLRQPEFELLDGDDELTSLRLGRIVPVYEAFGRITSGRIRLYVARALESLPQSLPDGLPESLRRRLGLLERRQAFEHVHFPAADTSLESLQKARSPAHFRLIFEELFYLQAGIEVKRRGVLKQQGYTVEITARVREQLKEVLPFHPTSDQKRVLAEIVDDMRSGHPMRRLLQGDVGSGKTIVALEAAVIAMENGYQVALMAPTQILAVQHYLYARERLPHYRVHLITGNQKIGQRRMQRYSLSTDAPQFAIGTHALLEGNFQFARLGLVIVDEQHRFGVLQRFRLMQKGERSAHVLVMTATPIPRTLALSLYGDLDVSFIRQLPPGRLPVITRIVPEPRSREVYEFVRKQVARGRQAYFVYPLIEESESIDLKPALKMYEVLRQVFSEFNVGLLHGRMTDDEKNATMQAFRDNQLQILVSTTVIEVGMDVPNATVMVIEHAERFGIAQLHQLRGRVGRPRKQSTGKSYCLLITADDASDLARRRLEAVAATSDGFELAELDLKLRGPGEFFGTRQSGLPAFQVADPLRDESFIELARSEARGFFDTAPLEQQRELISYIRQRWQRRYGLVEVG